MGNKSQWLRTSLLSFAELLDDSAVEQESEEELCGSRSSLERQGHRGNTTVHVCWHRNTSVSMVDFSIAVEVRSCMPSGPLLLHLLLLSSSCAVLSPVDVQFVFSVLVSHFSSHVCVYIFQFLLLFHFCPIFPLLSSCLLSSVLPWHCKKEDMVRSLRWQSLSADIEVCHVPPCMDIHSLSVSDTCRSGEVLKVASLTEDEMNAWWVDRINLKKLKDKCKMLMFLFWPLARMKTMSKINVFFHRKCNSERRKSDGNRKTRLSEQQCKKAVQKVNAELANRIQTTLSKRWRQTNDANH